MELIEGLGDEVTYALVILFVIFVLSLAWLSTGDRPFNYYVWLIQLQTWPQRRVIQVLHMDERSAVELEREASSDSHSSTRTWRVPNDDRELSTEDTSIITDLTHLDDLQVEIEEMNPSVPSTSSVQQPVVDDDNSTQIGREDHTESVAEARPSANTTCETETILAATQPSTPSTPSTPEPQDQDAQPGDTRIKLKFLDDTQKMVAAWLSQTVGDFKREHFTPAVHEGKVVRLIYRGQLLRDDGRSLASYGLHDNCIVHCHVSTTPYQAGNNNNADNNRSSTSAPGVVGGTIGSSGSSSSVGAEQSSHGRLHIGRYINVIFTLKFLALWLGAMLYPELFDFASFFSLFMCTVVYALFVFTNYRAREPAAQPRTNVPSAAATSNATGN